MLINTQSLPSLEGYGTKVAWAEDIRNNKLSEFEAYLEEQGTRIEQAIELAPQYATEIMEAVVKCENNIRHIFENKNWASFWINEKDTPVYRILNIYGPKAWANMI